MRQQPGYLEPNNHNPREFNSRSQRRRCHLTRSHDQRATSYYHFMILSHYPFLDLRSRFVLPTHNQFAAIMSSIAAMATRRALTRQPLIRAPPRRFNSAASKLQEATLDKAPKRDPELYVRNQHAIEPCRIFQSNPCFARFSSVLCLVLS